MRIMKRSLGSLAFVVGALACGLAFSQNPAVQDPAGQRIDKLEKDLAASRLRVEALSTEVGDLKKQVTAAVKYLEAQSKQAAAMSGVLDESEKAGFTYGLNPDSRHILLKGWRDQLATAQKDVPELPATPEATPVKPARAPAKADAKPPAKTGT
jgi:cell division protein FtsB